MRSVNADDFMTGLAPGIGFLTELARNANRLLFSRNVYAALCLNITGKIPLVGGAADVLYAFIKAAVQTLMSDPPTFTPRADGRNANGVKLWDPPRRCP